MTRSRHCLLALSSLTLALAFAACSSSSSSSGTGDDAAPPDGQADGSGGDDATAEASTPDGETEGGADATTDAPDATSQPDAGPDAHEGGATTHDAATEASANEAGGHDASNPEAASPEASAPEASAPEASTPEASTGEAGLADASSDAGTGAADASDGAAFIPPTCDGVISPGEYGSQTDGNNQITSGGQVWLMTWSDTTLYLAITGANTGEGAVLYFSDDPAVLPDAGSLASGSSSGFSYDTTGVAQLPMQAQLVAYVKDGYRETRASDGAGGWTSASTSTLSSYCSTPGGANVRELSIPWAAITGGARPSSFGWLGYVTSATGYVYGQVPPGNPAANIGTSAVLPWLYLVTDATPLTGTLPFANAVHR